MMPPPPPPQAPATAGLARQLYVEGLAVGEIVRRTGLSRTQVYHWIDRVVAPDGAVSLEPLPRRQPAPGVAPRAAVTRVAGPSRGAGKPLPGAVAGAPSAAAGSKTLKSPPPPLPAARSASLGVSPVQVLRSKAGKARTQAAKSAVPSSRATPSASTASRRPGTAAPPAGSTASAAPRRSGAASPRARLLARLWRAAERQVAEIEARIAAAGLDAGVGEPRGAGDMEKDARALALLARTLRELSAAEGDGESVKGKVASEDDTVRDLDVFRRELARRLDRLREGGPGPGAAG